MKKISRRNFIVAMAAVGAAGALSACGGSGGSSASSSTATATGSSDGGYKIGAYLQLSGTNAAYGIEARNAIQLAIDYVNENGGFNGETVEFVPYDTQGSAEEAVKIVSKLIDEEHCDSIIGSVNSSEVFAAAKSINDRGVYTLGLGTSPSWMAEDWPYVFRAAVNNNASIPKIVKMIGEIGYKSTAVFYGQDDASLATGQNFTTQCEDAGIDVVCSESYDQGDNDFSAQVTNLVNSGAECIYISVIGETGPVIVKQLRQYGYDGIIFDKESFMASQVEIAGAENSSYIAFANPYVTYDSLDSIDIPEVKEFAERYKEAYGEINKTDSAYRGWDTVMVMWEASKIAGKNDSDSLKDATNQISGLQGLGGTLDYTSGTREGYNDFNSFILVDGSNILWSDWMENGGYDEFLQKTGRSK